MREQEEREYDMTSPEARHERVKLRLLMGQNSATITRDLPPVDPVAAPAPMSARPGSTTTLQSKRAARRASLSLPGGPMGVTLTSAANRAVNSSNHIENSGAGPFSNSGQLPAAGPRDNSSSLQRPGTASASTGRRDRDQAVGTGLTIATRLSGTGLSLKNAPMHTKYLEELRRQVRAAQSLVKQSKLELLGSIDVLMDPAWRPPGRARMIAQAIQAANNSSNTASAGVGAVAGLDSQQLRKE